jgi:hypothetical protein
MLVSSTAGIKLFLPAIEVLFYLPSYFDFVHRGIVDRGRNYGLACHWDAVHFSGFSVLVSANMKTEIAWSVTEALFTSREIAR